MKQLLPALLLSVSIAGTASAQKIRFTDTSNRWKIVSEEGIPGEACQEIAVMKMGADTIIAGLSYKKPEILNYSYGCEAWGPNRTTASLKITGGYYREDTLLGRVYCRSAWPGDTIEHIIYDAGWRIGDTLKWGTSSGSRRDQGKSIVAGYDSAFVNNSWHKVFLMFYVSSSGAYEIVEGIGCLMGPGYPVHAIPPFENSDRLRCFSHAGAQPPFSLASGRNTGFDNATSCAVVRLSVKGESSQSPLVSVIPNPGSSNAMMHISPGINSGSVRLLDVTGRMIASITINGKNAIAIGQYLSTPGVYYYTLQDAVSGQRYTGKFIFR